MLRVFVAVLVMLFTWDSVTAAPGQSAVARAYYATTNSGWFHAMANSIDGERGYAYAPTQRYPAQPGNDYVPYRAD